MSFLACLPSGLVDAWTVSHILCWALLAVSLRHRASLDSISTTLVCVLVAICWEWAEPYTAEVWFSFHEPWWNRWITDPLADLIGTGLGLCLMGPYQGSPKESNTTAEDGSSR